MRICHLHNPARARSALGAFHEQPYLCVSLRHFRTSPVCPDSNAAAPQNRVSRAPTDPLLSRARRLEDAMRDVKDVFHRSAARAKKVEENHSAEVGLVRRLQTKNPIRVHAKGAAVDARSLGATPPPEKAPRFTIRRESAGSRGPVIRPRLPPASGQPPVAGASQVGRKRSGRKTEGGPKRTTSGRGGNKAQEREYQAMMKAYEIEQEVANAPQPVAFDPATAERTDLSEFGPAISSGESGMRDVLVQKQKEVELYVRNKAYIDRYQVFNSARSKGHLLSLTDGLDTAGDTNHTLSANKAGINDGKSTGSADVLNVLFSGAYISKRPDLRGQQQDVMSLVGRQAARNVSYEEGDEASLMARVNQLTAPTPKRQNEAQASNRQ